jgi:hypothetical protein
MKDTRSGWRAPQVVLLSVSLLGLSPVPPGGPALELGGTWRLLSFETWRSDGSVAYPLGENALGLLTYTPDHYFSMMMVRAAKSSPEPSRAGEAEMWGIAGGALAIGGSFQVNAELGVVTHVIHVSTFPSFIGQTQKRFFTFSGDRLALSTLPFSYQGVEPRAYWTWEKVKGPSG